MENTDGTVSIMPEIAQLVSKDRLKLPAAIAARFRLSDRFLVWAEGDLVHLKRITRVSVLDAAAAAPQAEPLAPEEINEIVHKVRRQQHAE